MKLKDFLNYISDEEARIELEIDDDSEDYLYESFWLSDYKANEDSVKYYKDYKVTGFRFNTKFSESDITIEIYND